MENPLTPTTVLGQQEIKEKIVDTLHFDSDPSFAELMDPLMYKFLYDAPAYEQDLENLFAEIHITKTSKLLDTSAGAGFPSLDLIADGYNIELMDASQDQIDLFERKAKARGIAYDYKKGFWEELPHLYDKESFDFLFCRGNSFIYATGGWNQEVPIDREESLKKYKETLQIFYDALKSGGYLYLDKFKDTETSHKEVVAKIQVSDNEPEDLIFWTQRFPETQTRRASMLRRTSQGTEEGVPNLNYDLKEPEVLQMMQDVGFIDIKKLDLPSEKYFTVWLARKPTSAVPGEGVEPPPRRE